MKNNCNGEKFTPVALKYAMVKCILHADNLQK